MQRGTRLALFTITTADLSAPIFNKEDGMSDERTTREKGTENKLRGKGKQVKGRVKDAAGGLTNDPELQAEGKLDKAKGKIQEKVGDVQRRVGRK